MKTGEKKGPSRRAARIQAFQVLYGLCFMPSPAHADLERLFVEMPLSVEAGDGQPSGQPLGQPSGQSRELKGFAWELTEGVWRHAAGLDGLIARFSRNWRVERMGRIELTLLRLAVFELTVRPAAPAKAIINEALDLTARFGDAKAKCFINGILDAVAKAAEAGELAAPAD
jgi:N utilization substance protein B